jgi:hypothetical protein
MSDGSTRNFQIIMDQVTDLHNMSANQFNQASSNLRVVDEHVGGVDKNVKLINSEVAKLARDFAEYVKKDAKDKAILRAETKIGTLRDKLKDQFGHHETVRKHTTGILQADDLELVRRETIETVTEELMLQAPGYWLAPCLVAIAAWLNDKKELADRAVREAIKRDDEKTSLLFGLICRRANRNTACLKWISRYLANQHEEQLDRKTVIILDAFASGLLGADTEGIVETQLEEWLTRLSEKSGFENQQITQWSDAINLKRKTYSGKYTYLPQYSKTWSKLQYIMEGAYLHSTIFAYFENIFNQQSSGLELKEQMDTILSSLVTDFDEAEIPLRQEYRLTELIIENNGDEERARRDMEVVKSGYDVHKDFTQLLTDAAMKPEASKASVSTQKFALALTREWINKAYRDIIDRNRKAIPQHIEINIDDFNDKTTDGKNEKELIEKFTNMVENRRSSANSVNVLTGFQKFCLWGGSAFILIGVIALAMGNALLGLLFLGLGIGWVINHINKKDAIETRAQEIKDQFDDINAEGIRILKATLAEVVDFYNEFNNEDSKSSKVIDFIDQIRPGETLSEIIEDSALSAVLPVWQLEPPAVAVRRKTLGE